MTQSTLKNKYLIVVEVEIDYQNLVGKSGINQELYI